jgi:hypothetical protein
MTPEQARKALVQATKPGTRKHSLAMALVKAGPKGATFKSLGRRIYGRSEEDMDHVPKLINVLRGIKVAIDRLELPIQVKREGGRLTLQDLPEDVAYASDHDSALDPVGEEDDLENDQGARGGVQSSWGQRTSGHRAGL